MITISESTEKTFVVVELQRKRLAVEQLQRKLESYLCVPQTYNLFEKKAVLKTELDRVASNTEELLSTLKTNDITIRNYIDDVERQFEEFNELHQEIQEYVKAARQ